LFYSIALQAFLERPREKDASVVARESQFLERELQIRETSKAQLRKYMVATDEDEPVDPKEWRHYKYSGPRDVPRHDVDEATEHAAQLKLFCYWRRRTLRQRVETKRQLLEAEKQASTAQKSTFGKTAKELFASKSSSSATLHKVTQELRSGVKKRVSLTIPKAKKCASLLVWPKKKANDHATTT
jgi:hypothetical protein